MPGRHTIGERFVNNAPGVFPADGTVIDYLQSVAPIRRLQGPEPAIRIGVGEIAHALLFDEEALARQELHPVRPCASGS
jgi:hypothetical protein